MNYLPQIPQGTNGSNIIGPCGVRPSEQQSGHYNKHNFGPSGVHAPAQQSGHYLAIISLLSFFSLLSLSRLSALS
jgi:hypothetical protein